MNKILKRIIRLFIWTLIVTFANTYFVEGQDETVVCDKTLEAPANYGLSLKKSGNSNYTISVNPNSNNSDIQNKICNVNFSLICNKITTDKEGNVTSQVPVSTGTVNCSNPYTFTAKSNNEEIGTYRCTLSGQSEVKVTGSDGVEKNCTANVNFDVDIENAGSAEDHAVQCMNQIVDTGDAVGKESINCSNPNGEFETSFCEAKLGAQKADPNGTAKKYLPNKFGAGSSRTTFNATYGSNTFANFKCNVQKMTSSDNTAGDKYYVNREYMYASGEVTKNLGKYQYHYDGPNNVTDGSSITCKIGCEESVIVEYGAPVASKAGLCFEYKVKVTSRVSCYMKTKPEKPEMSQSYCEPVPGCIHTDSSGNSSFFHQGGPNDEFDSCIQDCDGGKYTLKCSKSCYKKVYGKKNKISKTTVVNKSKARVQKLTNTGSCANVSKPTDKCYYYRLNGSDSNIIWSCGSDKEGRWYNNNWAGFGGKDAYRLDTNGIYRRKISDNTLCNDSCSWSIAGCSSRYLNPGWAEYDNSENAKKYNEAVRQCQALASCTTSTAEFTISTEYASYTDSKFKEINYPYTSINGKDTDKLSSGDNHVDTSTAKNTTILSHNGCYVNKEQRNWYQAEWSFPGSWINNKTGEISYAYKGSGWTEMKKAFCVPLDAKNVNQKWWNWAMKKTFSGTNNSISSNRYQEECAPYETSNSITKVSSISSSDIERWNINAKTVKFGYYEWNIHIQCFYALNTNPAMITSTSSEDTKKCCASECCGNDCNPQGSYRIRSVDLNNLFPDPNGKQTQPTEAGRLPGFNWTENATNMINNKGYTSDPQKYMLKVQELGNSVYNDDYLDYHFDLNKQNLSELQKNANYGQFNGKTIERSNKMTAYFSDVIRKYTNQAPQEKPATECNNLENWKSMRCYNP